MHKHLGAEMKELLIGLFVLCSISAFAQSSKTILPFLKGDIVFDRFTGCIDKVVKIERRGSTEITVTLSRELGGYFSRIPSQLIKLPKSYQSQLIKYDLSCGSTNGNKVFITTRLNEGDKILDTFNQAYNEIDYIDYRHHPVKVKLKYYGNGYRYLKFIKTITNLNKYKSFRVGGYACDKFTGTTVQIHSIWALQDEKEINFELIGEPGGYDHRYENQLSQKYEYEKCPFDE